jgi:hypothetical protein
MSATKPSPPFRSRPAPNRSTTGPTPAHLTPRAEAATMPELMSAAEIAELLRISRQRVHQLRRTAAFPAPLADLRGGAVWDAAAVRKFAEEWLRKPGRPAGASAEHRDRGSMGAACR